MEQQKKVIKQNISDIRWPPINDTAHNNQPKRCGAMEQVYKSWCSQGEGMTPSFWGAVEGERR
jgi:hypothetical protein